MFKREFSILVVGEVPLELVEEEDKCLDWSLQFVTHRRGVALGLLRSAMSLLEFVLIQTRLYFARLLSHVNGNGSFTVVVLPLHPDLDELAPQTRHYRMLLVHASVCYASLDVLYLVNHFFFEVVAKSVALLLDHVLHRDVVVEVDNFLDVIIELSVVVDLEQFEGDTGE